MKRKFHLLGFCFFCAAALIPVAAVSAETVGRTTVPVPAAAGADEANASKKAPSKVFADIAEVSPSIAVPTPLYADVKNLQDSEFDADSKLRTWVPNPDKFEFSPVKTDADGFFIAAVPAAVPVTDASGADGAVSAAIAHHSAAASATLTTTDPARQQSDSAGVAAQTTSTIVPAAAGAQNSVAVATIPAKPVAVQDTLTFFRTYATPQRFAKAKIRLTSPQKCELWIDGKKAGEKLSVEDTLGKSGGITAEYEFEGGRCEILAKVLTQKGSALPAAVKIEIESADSEKEGSGVPAIIFTDGKEKAPLTIAEVNGEAERVGGVSVSPDGKFVLLTIVKMHHDGVASRRTEVRSVADGKVAFIGDSGRNYGWMPTGSSLYFRRFDPNNRCSYIEYNLETQEESVLAENLPNENYQYYCLPDGSGFIVTKTVKWARESTEWTRILNIADRTDGWRDRTFLMRYDFKTGIFEQLTAGAKTTALSGVSPDSKRLLFSTEEVDYTQPEYFRSNCYSLNLETLECEPIFEGEKCAVALAAWSPDSKKAVFLGGPDSFGRIGSALPAGQTANSFDTQAFIYDFETKTFEAVTKDFSPTVVTATWAGDGNIYFRTFDRDLQDIYRYSPTEKTFAKLAIPAENVVAFSVQEDKEGFVPLAYAIGGGAAAFSRLYAVDLVNNTAVPVWNVGTPLEEKFVMPEVKDWEFTASDGTVIDGFYYLPTNFDPAKKYPLIVYYYGGTVPTTRAIGGHYPFPLYATLGYVVYVVEPSGTVGYGQAFSARHLNAWGKRTAEDIIEGTKQFCAEHPFVNPKKIGCIGASYGGFMTMYLQTRTDIFAAAVAHAGISDITGYWGEGNWGAAYNAVAAAGSFPWKNREIFVEQSPLFSADKINTPILLCHGTVDKNVPIGESIQMFAALKILGKPVEFLTFTGEDHVIMDYGRRQRWLKSHLAWFARWLKDEPEWWNTLYPDRNW